ncbi:hypothetical protein PR202_ga31104 [Eleusine coracana subsp. coracana]|uniref:DUF4283 domain-containing protein n=1 Tax=Eleusine coracana subsp. coracana TaxID=191504 RepID=A0AAV5DRR0_ELECO|nr:hypothetical protein PR202_ga31104 [Eleusine coracana subsp. coracana]
MTGGQRCRRRARRRRLLDRPEDEAAHQDNKDHVPDKFVEETELALEGNLVARPRRIIDRSFKIARAEEVLCNTLAVIIVGDVATVPVDLLVAEITRRFALLDNSLAFHRVSSNEGLLVLAQMNPCQVPPLSLHFKRWSRFMKATGVALLSLVEVELEGIPAHAWELETAEHLLDEWCWVRALHPSTVNCQDCSSFKLSAWCSAPEHILPEMNLAIVEPSAMCEEGERAKRALEYSIKIKVAVASGVAVGEESQPGAFAQKISKQLSTLVTTPMVQKRCKKTLPSDFKPRRSRRVAKLPPEATDHRTHAVVS